jgi:hypothetical protein
MTDREKGRYTNTQADKVGGRRERETYKWIYRKTVNKL